MRYLFISIFIMAFISFVLRLLPFVIFSNSKSVPHIITYLGKAFPPAVIGMLVIYCYKNINFIGQYYYLPSELVAGLVVIILHYWKRNILLSIIVGTILNMLMKQIII